MLLSMERLRRLTGLLEETRRAAVAMRRLLWSLAVTISAATGVVYAVGRLIEAIGR